MCHHTCSSARNRLGENLRHGVCHSRLALGDNLGWLGTALRAASVERNSSSTSQMKWLAGELGSESYVATPTTQAHAHMHMQTQSIHSHTHTHTHTHTHHTHTHHITSHHITSRHIKARECGVMMNGHCVLVDRCKQHVSSLLVVINTKYTYI